MSELLERLAGMRGRERARAVKALTPTEVLAVLEALAPRVTDADTARTDLYDLRKAVFAVGARKGLSRVKLGSAANVSDSAVKYSLGIKRSEPSRVS